MARDNTMLSDEVENQKDLGSERANLTLEDRHKFLISDKKLITVINPEVSNENTYLFVFKQGSIPDNFTKNNPFLNPESKMHGKVAFVSAQFPTGAEILKFSEIILEEIQALSLKRVTLIGFEAGSSVVQALTILSPRLFRRAVLVDPLSRISPGPIIRLIDKLENLLPVGLPFRSINKDFDSRPFLHRIRCPIMVVSSPTENFYNTMESQYIAKKIPNCYLIKLSSEPIAYSSGVLSEEFLRYLADFQESPAKRPQKNR